MRKSFHASSALGIAAALALTGVLSACDQRPTTARTDATTTTATTSTASDKMAATGDKVATAVDDSAITAKVKAALLAEPGLKSLQINVDTKNAAVTLSGAVDSDASKEKAKQVAAGVSGVNSVVDQLTVKS
jgi:hypothetical protein